MPYHTSASKVQAPETRVIINTQKPDAVSTTNGGTDHKRQNAFVPKELLNSSHVYVRADAKCRSLQARYDGPFAILDRRDKFYLIQRVKKKSWISTDRLKPVSVFSENPTSDPTAPGKYHANIPNIIPDTMILQYKKRVRFCLDR